MSLLDEAAKKINARVSVGDFLNAEDLARSVLEAVVEDFRQKGLIVLEFQPYDKKSKLAKKIRSLFGLGEKVAKPEKANG